MNNIPESIKGKIGEVTLEVGITDSYLILKMVKGDDLDLGYHLYLHMEQHQINDVKDLFESVK